MLLDCSFPVLVRLSESQSREVQYYYHFHHRYFLLIIYFYFIFLIFIHHRCGINDIFIMSIFLSLYQIISLSSIPISIKHDFLYSFISHSNFSIIFLIFLISLYPFFSISPFFFRFSVFPFSRFFQSTKNRIHRFVNQKITEN